MVLCRRCPPRVEPFHLVQRLLGPLVKVGVVMRAMSRLRLAVVRVKLVDALLLLLLLLLRMVLLLVEFVPLLMTMLMMMMLLVMVMLRRRRLIAPLLVRLLPLGRKDLAVIAPTDGASGHLRLVLMAHMTRLVRVVLGVRAPCVRRGRDEHRWQPAIAGHLSAQRHQTRRVAVMVQAVHRASRLLYCSVCPPYES